MRHPMLHRFLVWAGPSAIVGPAAFVGLVASLAQTYSGVKSWGQAWFDYLEPIMTAPWFLICLFILIVGYIGALVYTGRETPPERRVGSRPTSSLNNIELRENAFRKAREIRAFSVNANQRRLVATPRMTGLSDEQKRAEFLKHAQESQRAYEAISSAFELNHRGEALALLNELRARLGIFSIDRGSPEWSFPIDDGSLAGPNPLADAAATLDRLAHRLPD